jgi:hypothetical protein
MDDVNGLDDHLQDLNSLSMTFLFDDAHLGEAPASIESVFRRDPTTCPGNKSKKCHTRALIDAMPFYPPGTPPLNNPQKDQQKWI